jgi:hypothetical protein
MKQAVHEHLKVQRVNQPNRADPEKRLPSQNEPQADGKYDDRYLGSSPNPVSWLVQIRTPTTDIRARPLVDPSYVRPPEPTVARARHVFSGIGFCVMMPMIRHPGHRLTRRVEDGEEDKYVFNHAIQAQ